MSAAPIALDEIPSNLRNWKGWVLYGQDAMSCAFLNGDASKRPCQWPSSVQLDLNKTDGRFRLVVLSETENFVALPGDNKAWPLTVQVDGQTAVVLTRGESPVLRLKKGQHVITGHFKWPHLPSTLKIPADIGLIQLTVQGQEVSRPRFTEGDKLLLGSATETKKDPTEDTPTTDSLSVQVYRLLTDEIPLNLTTALDLTVAGRNREVVLGPLLPNGFVGTSVQSPLPVKIDSDGKMHIALRPGQWRIDMIARGSGKTDTFTLPENAQPWPPQELWVYQARPDLRVATFGGEGVAEIDPKQTSLPAEWQSFPAFQLSAKAQVKLSERERGLPPGAPNNLTLKRQIWLDFSGDYYWIEDHLSGQMTRAERLDVPPPLELGRITSYGEDQLLTKSGAATGIEIRNKKIQLGAELRLARGGLTNWKIPAIGWSQDLQSLQTTLHLPPGWRLLAVGGADTATATWIKNWNLENIFLLLIISTAIFRLFGMPAGILSFFTLLLTITEPDAPRYLWLALILGLALLKVLPNHKFYRFVRFYQGAVLLIFLPVMLYFSSRQIRTAMYPVLEIPSQILDQQTSDKNITRSEAQVRNEEDFAESDENLSDAGKMRKMAPPTAAAPRTAVPADKRMNKALSYLSGSAGTYGSGHDSQVMRKMDELDPNARVQTGYGAPAWRWKQSVFSWNGPVRADQELTLWLVPRWLNALLNVTRVGLLLMLLALLLRGDFKSLAQPFWQRLRRQQASALVVLLACLLTGSLIASVFTNRAYADSPAAAPGPNLTASSEWPSADLLDELRDRLLKQPDCVPECATLSSVTVDTAGNDLLLTLEIHTGANTAIPLPGVGTRSSSNTDGAGWQWRPTGIILGGNPASGVRLETTRGEAANLWLRLPPGINTVQMRGPLPPSSSGVQTVELPMPLKPQHLLSQLGNSPNSKEWALEGLDDDGNISGSLVLKRTNNQSGEGPKTPEVTTDANATLNTSAAIQAYVQVERQLSLGLKWTVHTRVERLNESGATVLRIPVLDGEKITTPGVRVEKAGVVVVNLSEVQRVVEWDSTIEPREKIDLTAPAQASWWELWRLKASSKWHIVTQDTALPPVQAFNNQGEKELLFLPFPGEKLQLTITKPAAAPGANVTLTESVLEITPGKRSSDLSFISVWSSSRAAEQQLTLPPQSELLSVSRDGEELRLRVEKDHLTLPLQAGTQKFQIKLRDETGGRFFYRSPAFPIGLPSANASVTINAPQDRWILFLGGDGFGPSVLFWSQLVFMALAALILGFIPMTPLRHWQWFLLGLGLSQASMTTMLVVVGFFLALGARGAGWRYLTGVKHKALFNFMQILLFLWALVAAAGIIEALNAGFVGRPDMQIVGNGSYSTLLRFFLDRTSDLLPQVWVVSVPIVAYQGLMLIWALWFAFALVKWAKWGYECISAGGIWQKLTLAKPLTPPPRPK